MKMIRIILVLFIIATVGYIISNLGACGIALAPFGPVFGIWLASEITAKKEN